MYNLFDPPGNSDFPAKHHLRFRRDAGVLAPRLADDPMDVAFSRGAETELSLRSHKRNYLRSKGQSEEMEAKRCSGFVCLFVCSFCFVLCWFVLVGWLVGWFVCLFVCLFLHHQGD